MKLIFAFLAACFIAYALLNVWRRPGFITSAFVGSYGLAVFFGPLGAILGLVALFAPVAMWATRSVERFRSPPPELALLLWALFSILTIFGSLHYGVAAQNVSALIGLAGGAYLMGRTFGDSDQFIGDLVLGAIIVMVICAFAILAMTKKVGVLGTDLNSVGLAVLVEIPLTGIIAVAVLGNNVPRSWRLAGIGILFVAIVPFSLALGNRSLLGAAVIVYLFFLVIRIKRGNARNIILVNLGALAFLVALGVLIVTQLQHIAGARILSLGLKRLFTNITNSHSGNVYVDPSVAGRLDLYNEAFDLIQQAPLLGHGIGSFGYLTDYQGLSSYPHNIFLEILVNTGVVGLVLFLTALVPIGLYAIKRAWRREGTWQDAFLAGLLGETLLRHQVSMSIVTGKVLFLSMGIIAVQWVAELNARNGTEIKQEPAGPLPLMADTAEVFAPVDLAKPPHQPREEGKIN